MQQTSVLLFQAAMVPAIGCQMQNMKTDIINGAKASGLSVAIQSHDCASRIHAGRKIPLYDKNPPARFT